MAAQRGKTSTLPRMTDLADALRRGDTTVAEVAVAHGLAAHSVRERISRAGYNPDTGQPHEKPRRGHTPLFAISLEEWMRDGSCVNHPNPDLWFGPNRDAAKAICATCPMRTKCLDYALRTEAVTDGQREGVWGGMTAAERDELVEGGAA